MIRRSSLSFRLIASAAVVSLILLAVAGMLLSSLFTEAVERNFDARLQAVMDGLLAGVEIDADEKPHIAGAIADTRFEIPLSGWYWQVSATAGDGSLRLASNSLLDDRLPFDGFTEEMRNKSGTAAAYLSDSAGTRLRVIEQRYTLFGSKQTYSFVVAGNFDELKREIAAFNNTLFLVLGLLGGGLVLAIVLQVHYGLTPLRTMQEELGDIREGHRERLAGRYPDEIQTVATELNLLLQANTEVIERARTQVGNLAHALKTPLSVLANEARLHSGPLAEKVAQQTGVMGDQVSLYLDRARRAARAHTIGSATDVDDVVGSLLRTLQRIHVDRQIEGATEIGPDAVFRGERQDLEEMVGNLLDNAFKWTRDRVQVTACRLEPGDDGRHWIEIVVADNGPGLPDGGEHLALERGRRLDETKPGSGLGLSIVQETAAMYGGSIGLARAPLGGLAARLVLPAAARKARQVSAPATAGMPRSR